MDVAKKKCTVGKLEAKMPEGLNAECSNSRKKKGHFTFEARSAKK